MKRLIIPILVFCAILNSCTSPTSSENDKKISETDGKLFFSIENTSELERTDEAITITIKKLKTLIGDIPEGKIPILETVEGKEIPSQTDDMDDNKEWDELFFVIDLLPKSKSTVIVKFVEANNVPKYMARTNLRFATRPENGIGPYTELTELNRPTIIKSEETTNLQMEGPAWENDKAAFRNYFDPRNGMDIFGKRVSHMVLDSVAIGNNYHKLQTWGMDVLKVGNSLGAGALAFYKNGKLHRLGLGSDSNYKEVADGPVRSICRLNFKNWNVDGSNYDIVHEITIWPGVPFYENKVTISGIIGDENIVAGIVNKHSDSLIVTSHNDDYISLITHDKQGFDGEYLAMGLLFNKASFVESVEAPNEGEGIIETYYGKSKIKDNEAIKFYFFAGWELQDSNFVNSQYFIDIVQKEADRLSNPVIISK